jgi:hypothetical protein
MWVQKLWSSHVSFEILPAVKNSIMVFWAMRPCGLVERHYHAAGNCYLHHHRSSVTMETAVSIKNNFNPKVSTHSHTHTPTWAQFRPQFKYCNDALIILFCCVRLEDLGEDARGVSLGSTVKLDWILLAEGKVHMLVTVKTMINFMFP